WNMIVSAVRPAAGSDLDDHAVMGRLHVGRQCAAQRLVVEAVVHMRQDSALHAEPRDPAQRFADAEVAWMRLVAQRIDEPDVRAFNYGLSFRFQPADIARVAQAADLEAERVDRSMRLAIRQ